MAELLFGDGQNIVNAGNYLIAACTEQLSQEK